MYARHLYRQMDCIVPGCERKPTCFCHIKHGLRGRSKWEHRLGFPGCSYHHDIYDGRNGASESARRATRELHAVIEPLLEPLWESLDAS